MPILNKKSAKEDAARKKKNKKRLIIITFIGSLFLFGISLLPTANA